MIPSDHPSITDEKQLHDGIRILNVHADDVLVLPVADCDFLLLGHLFHAVQELPLLDGRLKFQIFCRFIHPFRDKLHDGFIIPVQKIHRLTDIFPVFFF